MCVREMLGVLAAALRDWSVVGMGRIFDHGGVEEILSKGVCGSENLIASPWLAICCALY